MRHHTQTFHLKVQKVEQRCLFDLTWGQGQSLSVQVNYPQALTQLYQIWRQTYLNFYQSRHLRGRTISGGTGVIQIDWHQELVRAEAKFMYEFHRWLRSAELYDIRSTIASASRMPNGSEPIRVFLTCAPIELNRFPWETWELGTEFSTIGAIQIIRSPLNINTPTQRSSLRARRARILAILGDDTGLNFKADQEAVRSLSKLAEIKFVGWQPEKSADQVIKEIKSAIADEQGWDILFFAGHSNEADLTGGELGIAPRVSISINDIKHQLITAKKQGLQVAIFNSCSGLSIADSLVDLGFGQVVVMREPIHNRVAQEFLIHFLQGLGKGFDVYDAVLAARQFLQLEKSHTYPSASLVPSLFCHPGANLFQLAPTSWKNRLRQLLPTQIEAIALTTGILLSSLLPVQDILRDGRLYTQSLYRNITAQIPANKIPPIALIQMDTESLNTAGVTQFRPLDRTYLAAILDRLQQNRASVIGFDMLLDTPQKNVPQGDLVLKKSVQQAVRRGAWITFASIQRNGSVIGVNKRTGITTSAQTMLGNIQGYPNFVQLPEQKCQTDCPMSYLLAFVQAGRDSLDRVPQSGSDRRKQLLDTFKQAAPNRTVSTLLSWNPPFGLEPIIDFSLPPNTVYQLIPARSLLDSSNQFSNLPQQIVLVAPGGDERLGMGESPDQSLAPTALGFHTGQEWLTGGEALAYMTHHWLQRHLVIPIPDLWMVGIAVGLGKAVALFIRSRSGQWTQLTRLQVSVALVTLTGIYGLIVLQVYISALLLLPWLLPSAVFLTYSLSAIKRRSHV